MLHLLDGPVPERVQHVLRARARRRCLLMRLHRAAVDLFREAHGGVEAGRSAAAIGRRLVARLRSEHETHVVVRVPTSTIACIGRTSSRIGVGRVCTHLGSGAWSSSPHSHSVRAGRHAEAISSGVGWRVRCHCCPFET